MNFEAIANALIGSGPVALVLFYWVSSERKEKRALQDKLIAMLEQTAGLAEATRDDLRRIKYAVSQIPGSPRNFSPPPFDASGK